MARSMTIGLAGGSIALTGMLAHLGAMAIAQEPADSGIVDYEIVDFAIPEPLTDTPGNAARGRQIVRDINNVSCLICHVMPIPEEPDHGEIGPPLHGVGSRYTPGELRLRLVDSKAINPDSMMPSYYRIDGLYEVWEPYRGQTIYTAQQIEDVVAYLSSLQEADP